MRSARGPRVNGAALRAFRELAGKNKNQLSDETEKLGRRISPSHLSRLERGQRLWPSLDVTKTLAAALGVKVGDLLAHERCEEFSG